ncbi:MAG: PfkB family carbohydrate kinase, partial [Reyranellales bacterium]
MSRVVVCGSLNMDVIVQSARRPAAGETILGATVSFLPGGKGLNQAVAAARLGAPTAMLGAVGGDAFGKTLRDVLASNDVDSSGVTTIRNATTGVAVIQVAEKDNAITGASGANMQFTAAMVRREPRRGEVWVVQFETPIATTETMLRRARAVGARTLLN